MKVTILGSSSATPVYDRHPSSQVLSVNDRLFLIDCGEGTLFRLNELKIRKSKIQAIFISHLHGDHFYGLIGLLTTMSMQEREEKISIISPTGVREIIELQCSLSKTVIRFPIEYIVFDDFDSRVIYESSQVKVSTIPLQHKITTCGFLFEQKIPSRKILKEEIEKRGLRPEEIHEIVTHGSIHREGNTIRYEDISIENPTKKRYAYLSDTEYLETSIPLIEGIELLYHESTFMERDRDRAILTKHSTAMDAAKIAKQANVQKLILGHFSARYIELNSMLDEAREIFIPCELALEGMSFNI